MDKRSRRSRAHVSTWLLGVGSLVGLLAVLGVIAMVSTLGERAGQAVLAPTAASPAQSIGVRPTGLLKSQTPVLGQTCVVVRFDDAAYRDGEVPIWLWRSNQPDLCGDPLDETVVASTAILEPRLTAGGSMRYDVMFAVERPAGSGQDTFLSFLTTREPGDQFRAIGPADRNTLFGPLPQFESGDG